MRTSFLWLLALERKLSLMVDTVNFRQYRAAGDVIAHAPLAKARGASGLAGKARARAARR
ncbi:hypothetical protein PT2222_70370 [Paraburkholderia tropica]